MLRTDFYIFTEQVTVNQFYRTSPKAAELQTAKNNYSHKNDGMDAKVNNWQR